MNKKTLAAILSLPTTVLLGALVWAHDAHYDDRYIQISQFEQYQKDNKIDALEQEVDELTLKKSLGLASDYEKALLELKVRKLNTLLQRE